MQMKAIRVVAGILAIERVAGNWHTESPFRGCVHAQLVGASCEGAECDAAVAGRDVGEFVIGDSILSAVEVYPLARTVEPVGRKRQRDAAAAQEEIAQMEFTASAGGGMVEAVVMGDNTLKSVKIDPDGFHIMKKSTYSGMFGDYSSYSEEYDELSGDPAGSEGSDETD